MGTECSMVVMVEDFKKSGDASPAASFAWYLKLYALIVSFSSGDGSRLGRPSLLHFESADSIAPASLVKYFDLHSWMYFRVDRAEIGYSLFAFSPMK